MTPEALWKHYAKIWSSDAAVRGAELDACLAEAATYCDVNGMLEGRAALSGYMGQFQDGVPGGTFEILSVIAHHDRTLAEWRLLSANGRVLQTGRSFASLADGPRLLHITGFFDAAPGGKPA